MKRAWLEELIFGPQASRRFTQDSPVLPDVWLAFGEEYCANPRARLDLLLTPHRDVTPGELAKALQERLRDDRKAPASKRPSAAPAESAEIAFNQSTVVAKLTFTELIRVALPLSPWWNLYVCKDSEEQLGDLIARGETRKTVARAMSRTEKGQTTLEKTSRGVRAWNAPPDLLWTIKVVGAILLAAAAREGTGGEAQKKKRFDAITATANADALVERFARLVRGVTSGPGTKPLWMVSRNRDAAPTIWRSTLAVKADAAIRLFKLSCEKLTWAILDSGIDATHPAFRVRDQDGALQPLPPAGDRTNWKRLSRVTATYDFTRIRKLLSARGVDQKTLDDLPAARTMKRTDLRRAGDDLTRTLQRGVMYDWDLLKPLLEVPHDNAGYQRRSHEHGTHVAGILAADWRDTDQEDGVSPDETLQGICPDIRLFDLRVFDDRGRGDEFSVMAALQFIRHLNAHREQPLIHGANLSMSIRHDVANYACGRTPVCDECERVVNAGVVVVAAAGNDGYTQFLTAAGQTDGYRSISISDPGNAEGVITVGATHRYQPHSYGVSYFSSRGPTGDGRQKPDLVAPGEKIKAPVPSGGASTKDGTSMAAPHVSGAAALLLARHRELLGRPARVKQILCSTATDLGREKYFQGCGMVDVLRALQSV